MASPPHAFASDETVCALAAAFDSRISTMASTPHASFDREVEQMSENHTALGMIASQMAFQLGFMLQAYAMKKPEKMVGMTIVTKTTSIGTTLTVMFDGKYERKVDPKKCKKWGVEIGLFGLREDAVSPSYCVTRLLSVNTESSRIVYEEFPYLGYRPRKMLRGILINTAEISRMGESGYSLCEKHIRSFEGLLANLYDMRDYFKDVPMDGEKAHEYFKENSGSDHCHPKRLLNLPTPPLASPAAP
jgi:hypothetical protein